MSNSIETQIIKAEERLRLAMLQSDVDALSELLAPELIFTNHLGQVMSKEDDLEAHRSGIAKIDVLTPSEEHIQLINGVAIVSVRVYLAGSYADTPFEGDLRFTRIWATASNERWHIIAAHSSLIS